MLELLIIKIIIQNVIFTINYIRAICLKIYDRLNIKKKLVRLLETTKNLKNLKLETISVEVIFYIL